MEYCEKSGLSFDSYEMVPLIKSISPFEMVNPRPTLFFDVFEVGFEKLFT
jgi:hypothetical protein